MGTERLGRSVQTSVNSKSIHNIFSSRLSLLKSKSAVNHSDKNIIKHQGILKLISAIGPLRYKIPLWKSVNEAILYSIIGQMLSVSATTAIISRLIKRFKSAENIIKWATKNYRTAGPICGVSMRKRKALNAWYQYSSDNKNNIKRWNKMTTNEFRNEIKTIWGLGRWSADMLAIFHLGRRDVWPATDIGIKKISMQLFATDDYKIIKKYIVNNETMIALYFWEAIDNKLFKNGQFN
ncbi:MAG: hypothetical protein ABII27_00065 [bacterium]